MCKFYSAILTKNGDLFHNPFTTSHEDIIDEFNLNDNMRDNFIRLEFVPKRKMFEIDFYELKVDESITPEWFDENMKEIIINRLKNIIKSLIISDDVKLLNGRCAILVGSSNLRKVKNSIIYSMWENSKVGELRENSEVGVLRENSEVGVLRENSKVGELRENSKVGVLRENSKVGVLWENSEVGELWENSEVGELWENSEIKKDNRIKE